MTKLGGISGKLVVKKLQKIGYEVVRIRGSHIRLKNSNFKNYKPITVPNHKELKIGLLTQIIKDVKLTVDDFVEL